MDRPAVAVSELASVYRMGRAQAHSKAPPPSDERLAKSLDDVAYDIRQYLESATSKKESVLYLAYGSNLSNETFRGNRGIKPLSQINVQVPSLRLTFDLPGIPYAEPCFANSGSRDPDNDPTKPPTKDYTEKTPLLGAEGRPDEGYRKDRWHKGLIGVVYEVTPEDYAHIIATEGGGSSYHDILVDCHPFSSDDPRLPVPQNPTTTPFKAHTLFAPATPPGEDPPKDGGRFQRPDTSYAQPSARYLKLITDGANECGLPFEYCDYLHSIHPYTMKGAKQRVGQFVFLTLWLPVVSFIFLMSPMFQDEHGRQPQWLREFSGAIFKAVWASYDSFFKPMFGDGERSIADGGDDVDDAENAVKNGRSSASRMLNSPLQLDIEKAELQIRSTRSSAQVADATDDIAQKSTVVNDSPIQDEIAKASQTRRTRRTGRGGKLAHDSSKVMTRVSKSVAKKSNGSGSNDSTQKRALDVILKTTQRIPNGSSTRNSASNSSELAKAGSSVAALRARRAGGSPCDSVPAAQRSTITSKLSKSAASSEKSAAESSRQPLQDCDRNAKLPTPTALRNRSKDEVSSKQNDDLPDSLRSVNQRQTKDPVSCNGSKESRAYDRAKTSLTSVPGALKRPTPKADSLKGPHAPARGSTYRIRESSLEDCANKHTDRTSTKPTVVAKSKGGAVRSRTSRGAPPRSQKERLPVLKESHANGVQSLKGNRLNFSAGDHAPNAVKAMKVEPEPRSQAHSEAQKRQMSSQAHDIFLELPNAHIAPNNEGRPDESIEDFEKQVVAYSDHDRSSPVQTKPSVNHMPNVPPQSGQENRPGVSQQSAILLSDDCSSTPSDPGGSPKPTGAPARDGHGPRPTMKAPRTPATLHSSPPVGDVRFSKTPGTSLTDTSRKANIISFDDTGPRNQGSILMKTASGSAWASRTEHSSSPQWATQTHEAGSSRVSISGRCSRKPPATSSVAASLRTIRTNRSSKSANVASTVGEALAGFLKETHKDVTSPRKVPRSARVHGMSRAGQEQQTSYSSDAPVRFDEHEDAIMVNDVVEQNQPTRTESQLAMPPPPLKGPKAGDFQPPALARDKPLEMRERTKGDVSLSSSKKRSAITQAGEQPVSKRVKPTNKLSDSKFSAGQGDVTFAEGSGTHGPTATFAPNTKKALVRKPTRNPSQGNVDCHGSPVPQGLEVPANTTALEVYSQQANLSSDRLVTQHPSNGRSQRVARQNVDACLLGQHVLPPSHQPEIVSSNTKIRPASPQEDSQAITGVAIRRVESNSLVIRDVAAPPNTDPFTGSESARKDSSKTRPYSNFTQKLFQQTGEAGADLGQQAGGRYRPIVIDQAPKKHSSKRPPSWTSDDSNCTDVSAETTDTMRDIGIWRNALRPYQVDLFDELVTVSHRLMRSLIDRETAAREVVEDYRSRGTRLVAQMEETHALLYKEHMDGLTQRKKRLRKELGKCNDQLQEMVTTVKAASHERQERLQRRSNEVAKLRKLVDDWR
ncbi:hypothetical protein D0869_02516 [Hortaea werneckii]|uniref:gamma-glutamylcyclotransferase n=1 Tax=Hortaea werneckii TaxID=91943 RepID=A0A3M6X983_HORWE|nr:hypothetical protein D0869_02516 [Hortaea werneckii]RMY06306.1 hypothetical protein D0868_05934 [Hortaea werneckii]